jgi:hypothetical protein
LKSEFSRVFLRVAGEDNEFVGRVCVYGGGDFTLEHGWVLRVPAVV